MPLHPAFVCVCFPGMCTCAPCVPVAVKMPEEKLDVLVLILQTVVNHHECQEKPLLTSELFLYSLI